MGPEVGSLPVTAEPQEGFCPMKHSSLRSIRFSAALSVGVALLAALALPRSTEADDRDLLRSRNSRPYVFAIIDTSSSMNRRPIGPTAIASIDDPQSRLYLAKSALYEVVSDEELQRNAIFGWAHFNYENYFAKRKHFVYTRTSDSAAPAWFSELPWPVPGEPLFFGDPVSIDGGDANYRSCSLPDNNQNDSDRLRRLNYFPKLGSSFNQPMQMVSFINGNDWQINLGVPTSGTIGAPSADGRVSIPVTVIKGCAGSPTPDRIFTDTLVVEPLFVDADGDGNLIPGFEAPGAGGPLQLPSSFVANRFSGQNFGLGGLDDRSSISACSSTTQLDVTDAAGVLSSDLSYPRYDDPLNRGNAFARGDLIPWDWVNYQNRFDADGVKIPPPPGFERTAAEEILARLAPNTVVDGEAVLDADGKKIPDFRVARYFDHDAPLIGNYKMPLRSQFANNPPIAAGGGTPLAGVLEDFGEWFDAWEAVAELPAADGGDPNYECRQRFVILLTDGQESCGGDPAAAASALLGKKVKTFVIGFGDGLTGRLDDIADAGGTGSHDTNGNGIPDCAEYFPEDDDNNGVVDCVEEGAPVAEDRDELVRVLKRLVGATGEQTGAATFSAGGVPAQNSFSPFSAYFGNFFPIQGSSTWHGRVSHFVRPLSQAFQAVIDPLAADRCEERNELFCLAWEANSVMLGLDSGNDQVPSQAEIDAGDLRLGLLPSQRRVLYTIEPGVDGRVGLASRMFEPATGAALRLDLIDGLGYPLNEPDVDSKIDNVVARTLVEKASPNSFVGSRILGDSLHAQSTLVGGPSRTLYLRDEVRDEDRSDGYKEFFDKHRTRRRMLYVPANDGQIHAIDAGNFSEEQAPPDEPPYRTPFDLGTGQEVFSYIPRLMLPHVRRLTETTDHELGIDDTPVRDDFFIDPRHDGIPTVTEREWRTVLVGGLREGGSGYYALDVTQPDKLVESSENPDLLIPQTTASYVPTCITSYNEADCGPVEFPKMLWEFQDLDGNGVPRDDDANQGNDLGFTWSTPNTGRIRVNTGTVADPVIESRYVAIFGGGMDPQDPRVGNFIYIVDIETGKAIYKRPVLGAVPSAPAAVDADLDTYIDTVYVGTLAGYMYKIDLSRPQQLLADVGAPIISSPAWDPFPIYDTTGKQVFIPPAVVYSRDHNAYLLSFGTGDRENIFAREEPGIEGRYVTLLDTYTRPIVGVPAGQNGPEHDDKATDTMVPITNETNLVSFSSTGGASLSPDLISGGGYVITLAQHERLISRPFALSGLLVFSTFIPDTTGPAGDSCAGAGSSNVYSLLITNGNAISGTDRFRTVDGFVSAPFGSPSSRPTTDKDLGGEGAGTAAERARIADIRSTLMSLMPATCRFNNLNIELRAVRSDTGFEYVAEVPVCTQVRNWKDVL